MRAELVLAVVLALGCGPMRILTRPEGDGGWSADRRATELSTRADAARVDLAGASPEPTDDLTKPLDVEDVVRLATLESRRVVEADRDVDIARERVIETRGRYFPTFTGQGRYTWYTDPQVTQVSLAPGLLPAGTVPPVVVVREKQFGTANGTASVPIDLFGEITKNLTAAQAGYRAEEARRWSTVLGEQVAAVRGYFAVLEAESLRVVTEQRVAAQRQQLANAQSKFDAGRLTKNELLVVQVALRNTEQELRQRDLEIARARWALNQVVGRPVDAPTRLVDVSAPPTVPAPADALRDAYAHNPVLQALVEEQQRLEDTVSAIVRTRFPSVQAGGAIDYTSQDVLQPQRVESGFVGLSWTFDTGGRKTAEIEQVRLAAEQNRTRVERSLRDIEASVRTAQLAATERLAALSTAETAVRQAEENLQIRNQQFDVGRATSEDVLDAQALLALQRAALATALYEAHTRRAELQELMGLPLDGTPASPR